MLHVLLVAIIFSFGLSYAETSNPLEPESEEAWAYMLGLADEVVPLVYTKTVKGLSCELSEAQTKKILESYATEQSLHPSEVAESLAAYIWHDWTIIHVEGYDLTTIIQQTDDAVITDSETLELFLNALYEQHHPCLLAAMTMLVDGYEGYYELQPNERYLRLLRQKGEPYTLIALSDDYFPGTGVFEPLGIAYGVRLASLLKIDWLRKPVIEAVSLAVDKRIEKTGDPLKSY